MAMSTMHKILITTLVLTLLLSLVVDIAQARRGGGGGRSSGGKGRGSGRSRTGGGGSATRPKNYNNVALSGRILKGSSPYTKSTWRRAAIAGLIFGGALYLARPRHHPHYNQMPIICTNRSFKRDGKKYEHFICPLPDTNDTLKYCCGPERAEYCCDKATAQRYYGEHHNSSGSSPIGMIIGLIVLVLAICGIVYCCKKSGGKSFAKMFRSKRDNRDQSGITLSTTKHAVPSEDDGPPPSMPLTSLSGNNDASYPHTPADYPPPYNANSAAFDGSAGLPYAPPHATGFAGPAPYPPAGAHPYPPAPQGPMSPTPYPPPVDGAPMAPYPPAPYPAGAPPYPPYPGGDGSVPVPPYPGAPPPPASAPSYDSAAAYPSYGPGTQSKI